MMQRKVSEKLPILCWILFTASGLAAPPTIQASEDCMACHADAALAEDEDTLRLLVRPEVYAGSVHGVFDCVDCHADLAGTDPFGHDPDLAPVDCAVCHDDQDYRESLHSYARERGNERAPTCAGCHGAHDIRPSGDLQSRSHRSNSVAMCASCHGSQGLLTDQLVRLPQAVEGYARSVHGRASQSGENGAAICTDCHGYHRLKGAIDPESSIHPLQVASTCGACHSEIAALYQKSIHGRALQAGISDSPTCNDCHGEHFILSSEDPTASTHSMQLATQTCGTCHENSRIIEKYGLADYVVDTYRESYHGWATRLRSADVASCVDCHTAHLVLPDMDPASSIHSANLVTTCQQCHPGADESFARSYTHRTATMAVGQIDWWVRAFYYFLIPVTVGAMLIHNGIILGYYIRRKRRAEKRSATVVRLDRIQITQHLLTATSFVGLVVTGFALRFPESFWAVPLSMLGMDEATRSLLHRVFAVVLIAVAVSHVVYIGFSRRGRLEFSAMLPRTSDLRDMVSHLSFYVGRSRKKVPFSRYDYTQKVEYWALVWGTVLMVLTGFVLWFPAAAVKVFPGWIVQVSQTIHYYEAWLATLAIVVWHFFFVIFHPDVYPASLTWLTGKITKKELREHHGRWYQEEFAEPKRKPAKPAD